MTRNPVHFNEDFGESRGTRLFAASRDLPAQLVLLLKNDLLIGKFRIVSNMDSLLKIHQQLHLTYPPTWPVS